MQRSKNFVKETALRKISRVGLAMAVILAAFIGFLMLPADDLSLFASHPNPAVSYEGPCNGSKTCAQPRLVLTRIAIPFC